MNKDLIQKVQQGTHCIDFKIGDSFEMLESLIKHLFPQDIAPFNVTAYYYCENDHWVYNNQVPTGLIPIPLHQFFKELPSTEEGKEERSIKQFVKDWMKGHEPDTFIPNEYGNYIYKAGPTSLNLTCFFEHLLEDYIAENQVQEVRDKEESMIDYILDIDWLTTTEFCNKFNIPAPYYTGEIKTSVEKLLEIDAIKHRMFVEKAKELRRKPASNAPLVKEDKFLLKIKDYVDLLRSNVEKFKNRDSNDELEEKYYSGQDLICSLVQGEIEKYLESENI